MSKEIFDALGQVTGYALSVDDTILGDFRVDSPNGIIHGLRFQRDSHTYDVRAPPSKRYFAVDYRLRLSSKYYEYFQQDLESMRRVLKEHDVNPEEHEEQAQIEVASQLQVGTLPTEEIQTLTELLNERMTQVRCQHDWLWTGDENNIWDGIRVTSRIYPYEGDFTVRDYDQAVIDTISVGYSSAATISEHLDLSIGIDEGEPTLASRGFE